MKNKFRLKAEVYNREPDDMKINPKKMFFLSVEGNCTEKEYFNGISEFREQLGINAKVDVEVLQRSNRDTFSAPKQVLELLEEYLRLRELGIESLIKEIPKEFIEKYGIDFINAYLENPDNLSKKQKSEFVTDLKKIGYDINYRKYLSKYNNAYDEFGILIDRDIQNHSHTNMLECIQYCEKMHYQCYIANPCFELWLLFHLCDVKEKYKEKIDTIKENAKISANHTFVSKEVSTIAHHGKSGIRFKENYLTHVDEAIARAKEFSNSKDNLIDEVGCNLWQLLEKMKEIK